MRRRKEHRNSPDQPLNKPHCKPATGQQDAIRSVVCHECWRRGRLQSAGERQRLSVGRAGKREGLAAVFPFGLIESRAQIGRNFGSPSGAAPNQRGADEEADGDRSRCEDNPPIQAGKLEHQKVERTTRFIGQRWWRAKLLGLAQL